MSSTTGHLRGIMQEAWKVKGLLVLGVWVRWSEIGEVVEVTGGRNFRRCGLLL